MNEAAAFPLLQFLCSVPRRPPRKAANPETCDSRTCAGSLLLELTLLLSACSSSSCPRALPPFLSRLDWHCTSVRRPGERSDGVDPCLRAERTTSPAPPPPPGVSLTLGQHPHGAALPQPAVLALPPHVHVHLAAAAALAVVHGFFRHAAPEET